MLTGPLDTVDEAALLADGKLTLTRWSAATGTPLVLLHGMAGKVADLAPVLVSMPAGFEPYVAAYRWLWTSVADNGDTLADALVALHRPRVAILAHSLGGLIARRALNRLAVSGRLARFEHLQVVAIDSPWQGFGKGSPFVEQVVYPVTKGVLPPMMVDLASFSPFFAGGPSPDPADRAGLFGVSLPNVAFHLCFAAGSSPTESYASDAFAPTLRAWAVALAKGVRAPEPTADTERNLWRALHTATQFPALLAEAKEAKPDAAGLLALLGRHYPRFPGEHTACLAGPALAAWVWGRLTHGE